MAMLNDVYAALDGTAWVLVGGPGSVPRPLACARIGDLSRPDGDVAQTYVPSMASRDEYDIVNETQGPPGRTTFNVEAYVRSAADWLSRTRCPVDFYNMRKKCGDRRVFLDYDRGEALLFARRTNTSSSNLGTLSEANDTSMKRTRTPRESGRVFQAAHDAADDDRGERP
jgi:hypothetical protein